jgi:ubiquinone/menaquinone biosynthesis C-methylase UbiE
VKSDYGEIAGYYDRYRSSTPAEQRFWLEALTSHAALRPGMTALDVGCGTGRFSLPLAADYGLRVLGVDREPAMIARARSKPGSHALSWAVGDAQSLPLADGSVDAVLMCMMLHHVEDRPKALAAAHATLRPGGRLVIWTTAHGQIRRSVLGRYFPSLFAIDLARFPHVPVLMDQMRAAGFADVHSKVLARSETMDKAVYLEKVGNRFISTLSLIPEDELARGTMALAISLASRPGTTCERYYRYTFVTGSRPAAGR